MAKFEPVEHKAKHENGGDDEISVAGLSGLLADEQDAGKIKGKVVDIAGRVNDTIAVYKTASDEYEHEAKPAGGGDMTKTVYDPNDDGVVKDSDKLEGSNKATVQNHTPQAHKANHEAGGSDEIPGMVVLIDANETPASGTIGLISNDVAMKTYALLANSFSKIIVEFEGYVELGANSQIQLGIRGEIGGNNGPYQKLAQDATGSGDYFWIPFSVKFSIQQQTAVTITARIHHYLGVDSTYYCNSLRVYGVV
jgi:hypothetical protein